MSQTPHARQRLVHILDLADRVVTALVTPATSAAGISRTQWRVVMLLADGPGRTMGEIADRGGVPAPTATRVVDGLASSGLVYRRADPCDRRRVLVHISAKGHRLLDKMIVKLEETVGAEAIDPCIADALQNVLDALDRPRP